MRHRVLFLGEKNVRTGWGRYQASLAHALQSAGHTVSVEATDEASSGRLWTAFFRPWRWVATLFRWMRLVRREQVEVIHVTVEPLLPVAAIVSYLTRTPLVLTIHGSYANPVAFFTGWKQRYVRWLVCRSLGPCSQMIAVSRYTADYFKECFTINAPVRVIESGVTQLPTPTSDEIRLFQERCHLQAGEQLLLMVGAWKPRRGQLEAVRVLRECRKRGHDKTKLVFVGAIHDQLYAKNVHTFVENGQLGDQVYSFQDIQTDGELAAAYASAQILLVPSCRTGPLFEGFGLVALEANQFGVPAIGFRGTGVEDAILPGISGQLVAARDISALADAIENELKQPLSKEGIVASVAQRTWKACAERVESVYDDVCRA